MTTERISLAEGHQAWYALEQDLFYPHRVPGDGQWIDAPLSVCMQTGTRCNLECHFCLSESGPEGTTDANWLPEAVSAISRHAGPTRLIWSGGEPTLIRELGGLLRHAKELGHVNVLATNGTRSFESPHVDWVDVSIYGADEQEYRRRTGRRACERIWRNIAAMLAGPARISVNVLLGVYDDEAFTAIVSRALEAGVARIKFHRALPIGRSQSNAEETVVRAHARMAREILDCTTTLSSFPLSDSARAFIDSYLVIRAPGLLTNGRWCVPLDDHPMLEAALSHSLGDHDGLFLGSDSIARRGAM